MKYIKLFENFSTDWKERLISASNMLDVLYDLKEVAIEYLDVRHKQDNRFSEDDEEDSELLDKKLIYIVDLHDREDEYMGNLCGGQYSLEDTDVEGNLYWSEDITSPIEEIESDFKSDKLYLNITFCIVVGEEGDYRSVSEDTSGVYGRISDMYPEVGFDTFNPWDLN